MSTAGRWYLNSTGGRTTGPGHLQAAEVVERARRPMFFGTEDRLDGLLDVVEV